MIRILLILFIIIVILIATGYGIQWLWTADKNSAEINRHESKQLKQLQLVCGRIEEALGRVTLPSTTKLELQNQLDTLQQGATDLLSRKARIRDAMKVIGNTENRKLTAMQQKIDDALTRSQLEADELLVGLLLVENQAEESSVNRLLDTLHDHNLYIDDVNQSFEELRAS